MTHVPGAGVGHCHLPQARTWSDPALHIAAREVKPGVVLLAAHGELDLQTSRLLTQALLAHASVQVILDLAGITFCDVAGARVLEAVGVRQGYLAVVVSTAVRLVLDATGIAPSVRQYAWLAHALAET
ncbi:STAS domain-containing protein [Prauserella oleivorans]|uniref:STAS domain-containing protein n=1 Tax=Prauserella oleivorans TaxID=1478153 RepID=A0ABW5W7Y4_9PSEU